jgi:hypothetical protein
MMPRLNNEKADSTALVWISPSTYSREWLMVLCILLRRVAHPCGFGSCKGGSSLKPARQEKEAGEDFLARPLLDRAIMMARGDRADLLVAILLRVFWLSRMYSPTEDAPKTLSGYTKLRP